MERMYRGKKQIRGCLGGAQGAEGGYVSPGNGFMGVYVCQNFSKCTLQMCVMYCTSVKPDKAIEQKSTGISSIPSLTAASIA